MFYDISLELITGKQNAKFFFGLFFQKKTKGHIVFIQLYEEIHTFNPSGFIFRFVHRLLMTAIGNVFWSFFY